MHGLEILPSGTATVKRKFNALFPPSHGPEKRKKYLKVNIERQAGLMRKMLIDSGLEPRNFDTVIGIDSKLVHHGDSFVKNESWEKVVVTVEMLEKKPKKK